MKAWFCAMAACMLALGLAGCSTTNDRGVNISRSTDLFGAARAQPVGGVATLNKDKPAPGAKS